MRTRFVSSIVAGAALALPAVGQAALVSGDYVEARSADVWTGPCFANAEMGLAGQEAILAWRVREGGWSGVPLVGLSVVGVVRASATLGDPFASPLPVRSVLIVDERATPAQRTALLALARAMGGDLFGDVVETASAPIRMDVQGDDASERRTRLEVGDLARIETRTLADRDRHCGNESTYYPPLTPTTEAAPAVSVVDGYHGPGLGVVWTTHDKRNAFVGSFAR
ncbi:MAG TPA: DUF1326 domain-containing protein [Vicinamibacteria bacterium]|nr:DUF1326 domain-containing protein [Vicinamibacteria bacterium]